MRPIQRIAPLGLVLALAAGCVVGGEEGPPRLTGEETRLVEETLQHIRIRLEAARDGDAAEGMPEEPAGAFTDEERAALLDRLASHPARGELVISALHDSLEAMREELFPAQGVEADPANPRRRASRP